MQKNKKKPTRRCMGCNEAKEKQELLRIVKSKEGIIRSEERRVGKECAA